jgi:hypothetical protein
MNHPPFAETTGHQRRHLLRWAAALAGGTSVWPGALHARPGRLIPAGGAGGASLAQALRRAAPGDTVELHGDLNGDVAVIEQPGITLRGAGARKVLHAAGRHAEGKAILVVRAQDTIVENLEFRGARVPSGNGAGIRFESGSLSLRRCAFFDNENGLLAANRRDMRLYVDDCEFGNSPRHAGLLHHQLYVGAIGRLDVSRSRFGGGFRGHLLKSRALENLLWANCLNDGEGGMASYEMELPNGGVATIVGNFIAQSAGTGNPALLSIGAEAQPGAVPTKVRLAHNTFIQNGASQARFVHFWQERLGTDARLEAADNLFIGPGQAGLSDAQDLGGNRQQPTRGTLAPRDPGERWLPSLRR